VRLTDGRGEATPGLDVFAADVDEARRAADRARRDQHALDQRVRVTLEQVAVLERPRLALVGVDDEVHGPGVGLRNERPLRAGREARAAEPAEVRGLDVLDDGRGLHRLGLGPRLVAARRPVPVERVGVLAMEAPGEDLFVGHTSPSRMRSIFTGVRFISYRASSWIKGAASHAQRHSTESSVTRPSSVVSPTSTRSRCLRCAMIDPSPARWQERLWQTDTTWRPGRSRK